MSAVCPRPGCGADRTGLTYTCAKCWDDEHKAHCAATSGGEWSFEVAAAFAKTPKGTYLPKPAVEKCARPGCGADHEPGHGMSSPLMCPKCWTEWHNGDASGLPALQAFAATLKAKVETPPVDRCERVGCDRPQNGKGTWCLCAPCAEDWRRSPSLRLAEWKAEGITGKPKPDPTPVEDPECRIGTEVPRRVVERLTGLTLPAEWKGKVVEWAPDWDVGDHERYGIDGVRIDGPRLAVPDDYKRLADCAYYPYISRVNCRRSAYLAAMRAYATEQQTARELAARERTRPQRPFIDFKADMYERLQRHWIERRLGPEIWTMPAIPAGTPLRITNDKPTEEKTAMSETRPETAARLRELLDRDNIDIALSVIDRVEEDGLYLIEADGTSWKVHTPSSRPEIVRLFALYQKETTMDKTDAPSIADSAKTYAATVAYRTAALQLTKRTRGLLADALVQHLKGKQKATKRAMILDVLDGPAGGPLVAMLLSGLLPQAAGVIGQRGEKVDRLAEELRLHAGVAFTSELVDGLFSLLGPAKEALTQALSGLPDVQALPEAGNRCAVIDIETAQAKAR